MKKQRKLNNKRNDYLINSVFGIWFRIEKFQTEKKLKGVRYELWATGLGIKVKVTNLGEENG